MAMGGVSIFGKYCKEILGGGSDKKFPQQKNQLLLYKKPTIKTQPLFIEKFPQRNIQYIQYI